MTEKQIKSKLLLEYNAFLLNASKAENDIVGFMNELQEHLYSIHKNAKKDGYDDGYKAGKESIFNENLN